MPGEFAEMMLDGTLCEGCGVDMGNAGEGFPRYCSDQCARDRGALTCEAVRGMHPTPTERARWRRRQNEPGYCPLCARPKTGQALSDHMRDAHGMRMIVGPIPRAMMEGDL